MLRRHRFGKLRKGADARLLGCPRTDKERDELEEYVEGMQKFQTMDLELHNDPLRQATHRQLPERAYRGALLWRWILVLIAGFMIGVGCFFFNWAVKGLWLGLYRTTEHVIKNSLGFWKGYATYLGITVGYAAISTIPVICVGRRGLSEGGGIAALRAYFNGIYNHKDLLKFWPTVSRLVSGVFVNGSNLIGIGEAPLVHCASSISHAITKALRKPGFRRAISLRGLLCGSGLDSLSRQLDNEKDHRDVISMGSSAGFAMAFVTPIAGTLFPMEEGGISFSPSRLYLAFMSTMAAMWGLMAGVMIYKQRSFWNYKLFDLEQSSDANLTGGLFYCYIWEVPIFLVIGLLAGLAGAAFVAINMQLRHFRQRYMLWGTRGQYWRILEVLLIAVVASTAWFLIIYNSPCAPKPPPDLAKRLMAQPRPNGLLQLASRVNDPFPQLYCPAGQHAVWGTIFWQPLQGAMKSLVHANQALASGEVLPPKFAPLVKLDNSALAMFMVLEWLLITWMYGAALAFSAITPALGIGAAMGQLIAHGTQGLAAVISPDSPVVISSATYAMVGAAAMLSSFVRYKTIVVIMVAEITGAIALMPAFALSSLVATSVADLFGPGIYDAYLQDKQLPLLKDPISNTDVAMVVDRLTAEDLMKTRVVTLPCIATLGQIIDCIRSNPHQTYVLAVAGCSSYEMLRDADTEGGGVRAAGTVKRKALLQLIRHRAALRDMGVMSEGDGSSDEGFLLPKAKSQEQQAVLDAVRPFAISAYIDIKPYIRDVTEEQRLWRVDLRTFARQSPTVVQAHASAVGVHHAFRHLGCHEVLVTREPPLVCGVIGRKDITRPIGQLALWEKNLREGLISETGEPATVAALAGRLTKVTRNLESGPAFGTPESSAAAAVAIGLPESSQRLGDLPSHTNGSMEACNNNECTARRTTNGNTTNGNT